MGIDGPVSAVCRDVPGLPCSEKAVPVSLHVDQAAF